MYSYFLLYVLISLISFILSTGYRNRTLNVIAVLITYRTHLAFIGSLYYIQFLLWDGSFIRGKCDILYIQIRVVKPYINQSARPVVYRSKRSRCTVGLYSAQPCVKTREVELCAHCLVHCKLSQLAPFQWDRPEWRSHQEDSTVKSNLDPAY